MKPVWLPSFTAFFFCAFISLAVLYVGSPAMPAFYSFLPMCFFFLGAHVYALNKEIVTLRKRLDEIGPQTPRGVDLTPGTPQASTPPS